MTSLDPRILRPGMGVTVSILVDVYQDHYRHDPTTLVCPCCGHQFPKGDDTGDCPTMTVVRPLLYQRRHTDPTALARLTPDQYCDLHDRSAARANRAAELRASAHSAFDSGSSLFDHTTGGH